jgi:hypothetical protein
MRDQPRLIAAASEDDERSEREAVHSLLVPRRNLRTAPRGTTTGVERRTFPARRNGDSPRFSGPIRTNGACPRLSGQG